MAKQLRKLQRKYYTWEEALNSFLLLKQAEGKSERTVSDYKKHVGLFFKRFPDAWQSPTFSNAIMQYMGDKIMPATYNIRLVNLKTFFEYCVKENHLEENPLKEFKRRKALPRIVDIQVDTLSDVLDIPDQRTFPGLRDYAIIVFTLDTGIRPSEALALKVADFDLEHNLITVPASVAKTRTPRTIPILSKTSAVVSKLLSVRPSDWNSNIPVFCSCEGTPLNVGTYRNRLRQYSDSLGQRVKPYDLRHAFALMYLRNGGNAFGLQQTLGHTDMEMTKRYVHMTGTDLQEAHKKASPLNALMSGKKKERIRNIK